MPWNDGLVSDSPNYIFLNDIDFCILSCSDLAQLKRLKEENSRLEGSLKLEREGRKEERCLHDEKMKELMGSYEKEKSMLTENMRLGGEDIKQIKTKLTHAERDVKEKEENIER